MKKELIVMWVFEEKDYLELKHFKDSIYQEHTPYHPHITFAHYPAISQRRLIKHLDAFIKGVKPFQVEVDGYLTLGNTQVIKVLFEGAIKGYYQTFNKKYHTLLNQYTKEENYTPHISLSTNEKPPTIPIKKTLTIDKCHVSWNKKDGFEIIKTYQLK